MSSDFRNNRILNGIRSFTLTELSASGRPAGGGLPLSQKNFISSFTLVELLMVIGIIAVLAAAVVLVLNPVEYLGQSRDATRISNIDSLNTAVGLYAASVRGSKGTANTVYISIPDTNASCSGISGLPALPSGWSYACSTAANYTKTDGTGWLPVNFNALIGGSTLDKLPIDPDNTATSGRYYAYMGDASGYEFAVLLESEKQLKIKALPDGGVDAARYEKGSVASYWATASGLAGYWPMDEGSGTTVRDGSGCGGNGTIVGTPTWVTGVNCRQGGCLTFASGKYVTLGDISQLKITGSQTITMWVKPRVIGDAVRRNPFAKAYGGEGTITQEPAGGFSYYYGTYGGNSSPYQGYGSPNVLTAGGWTYLTIVRDLVGMKLYWYIDGTQRSSATALYASAVSSTLPAYIGHGYTNDYDGEIDEVRVYARALSDNEISALYRAER